MELRCVGIDLYIRFFRVFLLVKVAVPNVGCREKLELIMHQMLSYMSLLDDYQLLHFILEIFSEPEARLEQMKVRPQTDEK
jgi:hypothetical protein